MVQWVTYWPGKNLTYLGKETFWVLTAKHLPTRESDKCIAKWFSLGTRLKSPFWQQ